jgi:hypothetical protein
MSTHDTQQAAPAPLSAVRPSARIIPLPGAAVAPVVNPARPRGRPPQGIVGIWRGKEIRAKRAFAAERQRNAQASAAELLRTAYLMLKGEPHD